MNNESLLVALADLRRLDKKVFLTENLLTRAFTFLLRNDNKALRSYLKYIGIPYGRDCTVKDRPVDRNGKIPDMEIASSARSIFVLQENKIDSPEAPNQRKEYLKILNNHPAKHRLLLYVAPRINKRTIHYPVPQKFLTWDEIHCLIKSAPMPSPREAWLREEFLKLLEDRNMASPNPIHVRRLTKAWVDFDLARTPLKRMFFEIKNCLEQELNKSRTDDYRIRLDERDYSLAIRKTKRGPLKKPMQDENVWVWLGIFPDDSLLYICLEIGFLRSTYGDRLRNFRKKSQECNFTLTNYRLEKYDCEGHEKYRELTSLLNEKHDFRKQLNAVLKWVSNTIKDIPRLIKAIEKDLRQ
jgi:hypothetical protein